MMPHAPELVGTFDCSRMIGMNSPPLKTQFLPCLPRSSFASNADGGGDRTEHHQMPVEESGNMLILAGALAQKAGSTALAEEFWAELTSWADYLVRSGLESPQSAIAYLRRFAGPAPITVFLGHPEIGGRFFYNDEFTGFNFKALKAPLGDTLDRLQAQLDDAGAPSIYVGSTDVDLYLPQLRKENDLLLRGPAFENHRPIVSIWLGNRTVATAHYDSTHNLACCAEKRHGSRDGMHGGGRRIPGHHHPVASKG